MSLKRVGPRIDDSAELDAIPDWTTASDADAAQLYMREDLVVRQSSVDRALIELAWGSGSERQYFTTDSDSFAHWLLSVTSPFSRQDGITSLSDSSQICFDDARVLVDLMRRYGLISNKPYVVTPSEKRWEALEWHDALTFHRATKGMRWRHEYPDGARVFTWFDGVNLAIPDTKRPEVPDAPGRHEIALPQAELHLTELALGEALTKRRTTRNFAATSLDVQRLSEVLHWACRPLVPGPTHLYKTSRLATDAGKEYQVHEFVTVFVLLDPSQWDLDSVSEQSWAFRYSPSRHALSKVNGNSLSFNKYSDLLWRQPFADGAPAMLVFAINWEQYSWKYRDSHHYRMAHYDIGACAQTAAMVSTALGLRTFVTPAVNDELMARLLGTDESTQAPTYVLAIGADDRSRIRVQPDIPALGM